MSQRAEFDWKDMGSGQLLVCIRGEIDHHTAVAIRTDVDALLFRLRPTRLILDLSAVSFMDSSGLGLIMGRYGIMRELGGEISVRDPSPETRSILTLAGMERLVHIEYTAPPEATGKQAGHEQRGARQAGRSAAPGQARASTPGKKATATGQKRRKAI